MPGISKIIFAIGVLLIALSLGAADKPSKNSKPTPVATSPDKSVEALAATALKSVVGNGDDGFARGLGESFDGFGRGIGGGLRFGIG